MSGFRKFTPRHDSGESLASKLWIKTKNEEEDSGPESWRGIRVGSEILARKQEVKVPKRGALGRGAEREQDHGIHLGSLWRAQPSSSSLMVMRRGQMRIGLGGPSPRVPPR